MMKPSSFSTWATCSFMCVEGISTAGDSMRLPLRIRVNMSAIGSVIMGSVSLLPAGLGHTGDQALARHVAEADAAEAELAVNRPRPAAQPATQADANSVARPQLALGRLAAGNLKLLELPLVFDVLCVC